MQYTEKVMQHFMNPHNVGVIENPDGYGKVGNPSCGDIMEIFIKVDDDKISDVKFRTFGCASAIDSKFKFFILASPLERLSKSSWNSS